MAADLPEDVIGIIRLDLVDWRQRRPAAELTQALHERIGVIPGLAMQIREQDRGPGAGLPVQIEVAGPGAAEIIAALDRIHGLMDEMGGFVDTSDDRPLAGIELRVAVDRAEAARYGADVAVIGSAVQLLTEGLLLGTYRPDFVDEEVDLRLRFPPGDRHVGELANLRVLTPRGLVPITNFVTFEPVPLTGLVTRVDGRRVYTISADVAPGALVGERVAALGAAVAEAELGPGVTVHFRGQTEDQAEAGAFLLMAFALTIFLMFLILVLQFNSLFQAVLVLSAIVFSIAGVLLGLMLRRNRSASS